MHTSQGHMNQLAAAKRLLRGMARTVSAALALSPLLIPVVHATETVYPVRNCASLVTVGFGDGSKVTSAEPVPASSSMPEFCNVTLVVPDRINIVVMLPTQTWNGRFQAVGNSGYAGYPGILTSPTHSISASAAVANGYATAATDTGHTGAILDGQWAWSPSGMHYAQIQDFAYRANHEMAVKSKILISHFYGRGPSYSYWNGCSTGGREGLTAAMRYPKDFDGIMAAAPAINWTKFIPAEMWPQVVMKEMGNYLPSCKTQEVSKIVHQACDLSDGLADGLIDTLRCNFDPKTLLGKQSSCGTITDRDVAVIEKIWQGPRRRNGDFIWYGLEPGTDLGSVPGLTLAHTVSTTDGTAVDGIPFPISNDWFRWWLHKDPLWDWHTLNYDLFERDFDQSVSEWASVLATNDPDLSAFYANGGKIVIWHGMADQLIFPKGSIDYYERVMKHMGPGTTRNFARLFLAHNVAHCVGGTGPAPVDPLAAVVKWREQGQAPERLLAALPPRTGVNTTDGVMTRPLCPYPEVAVHKGGSIYSAENFTCSPRKN